MTDEEKIFVGVYSFTVKVKAINEEARLRIQKILNKADTRDMWAEVSHELERQNIEI